MRSYSIKHNANKGKLDKIYDLYKPYRKYAAILASSQWDIFYKYGYFNKNEPIPDIPNCLISKRYLQTIQYQVVGVLNGYIENVKDEIKKYITKSNLDKNTKHILYTINKYKLFYKENPCIKKEPIEPYYIKLARYIFKHVVGNKWKKPSYKNINLNLDAKVASISKNDGSSSFDYWVKLSTLEKNKPILVPISSNEYFNSKKGEHKNFLQINKDRNTNELEFRFVKNVDIDEEYVPNKDCKITLDVGVCEFLATQYGDFFGRDLISYLKKKDKKLKKLDSYNRKTKNNIKSKQHNAIVKKIRNHLKHVAYMCIKRIVEIYKPSEIVLDNPNFHCADLSPTMNRILRNCGMKVLKQALQNINETKKIIITFKNTAYSSKTCPNPKCGYVDEENRVTRDQFVCKCCGKKCHADVVGARSHLNRSSDSRYDNIYQKPTSILQMIIMDFLERHNINASCSWAKELLVGNKYFLPVITKMFPEWFVESS